MACCPIQLWQAWQYYLITPKKEGGIVGTWNRIFKFMKTLRDSRVKRNRYKHSLKSFFFPLQYFNLASSSFLCRVLIFIVQESGELDAPCPRTLNCSPILAIEMTSKLRTWTLIIILPIKYAWPPEEARQISIVEMFWRIEYPLANPFDQSLQVTVVEDGKWLLGRNYTWIFRDRNEWR